MLIVVIMVLVLQDQMEQKVIESINNMNLNITQLQEEIRKERERNEMANQVSTSSHE